MTAADVIPDEPDWFREAAPVPLPAAFDIEAKRRELETAGGALWVNGTPEQRDRLAFDLAESEATRAAEADAGTLEEQLAAFVGAAARPSTLAGYLEAVRTYAVRYVAFPSEHEPVAFALWIAHAHVVEVFETSPILAVTSAEMRSGKTRVLDVAEQLVPNPYRVVTPSEAVVYTVLSQRPRPTLLLDEADAIFGPRTAERYEGVRAILNAGNKQGTPVLRVKLEGRRREVEAFDVYGPKAVAGIGNLPPTVADRSIPIRMRRRAPSEPVAKFRTRAARAEAEMIVLDWSRVPVVPVVPVPEELNDRAADSWEPLIAIADAAGGSWPTLARLAAVALSSEDESPVSVGMRLLSEIKDVFGEEDHLTTGELLRRLHDLDDAPWGDWYGSPLSARALAKLLDPYRVAPLLKRIPGQPRARGYFRSDFLDAWTRYVPGAVLSGTVVTVVTVPQTHTAVTDVSATQTLVVRPHSVVESDRPVPEPVAGTVTPVTSVTPGTPAEAMDLRAEALRIFGETDEGAHP